MTATRGSGTPTASAERAYVRRFSGAERALHWIHALSFFGLLATGLVLYLPSLAGTFGSREEVKTIHLYIAAAWLAALLAVIALADRRRLGRTVGELERLDTDDLRWLTGRRAPQGRFNAGQKVHAVAQAAFAVLFVVSGSLLLWGEANTSFRLAGTILLHDGLTVTATLLVLGHLYLALVHPRTRPALRGMVRGSVSRDWARDHHSKWDVTTDRGHTAVGRAGRAPTVALLAAAALVVALAFAVVPRSVTPAPAAVGDVTQDSQPVVVQKSKRPPLCVLTQTCFGP